MELENVTEKSNPLFTARCPEMSVCKSRNMT